MNKKFTKLMAALALLVFMMPSLAGWGQTSPWSHEFLSPEAISNNSITVDGATWSVSTVVGAGSPTISTGTYSQTYGLKFGSSKSIYFSSVTFTTDYFANYNVQSVSVNILNNGSKQGTLTAQQGNTSIGSTSATFGQTWTNLIVNTNTGSGGSLSFTYSVEQAFYLHSITVTYTSGPVTYTVTYDCNGGTSGCPTENPTGLSLNDHITLAAAPSKPGHSFSGWNDGTTTYAAGADYTVTSNVTMTAQWTINTHNVTVQGNTHGTVTGYTNPVAYGTEVTLVYTHNNGEYYSATYASTDVTITDGTFTMPDNAVTITVDETALPVYTVTFSDGGYLTEAHYGAGVTLPNRTGDGIYSFAGWTTSNIAIETTTAPAQILTGTYHPTENIILYPVYTRSEGEGEKWQKITDFASVNEGTYALITTTGLAFTGTINSSGHGTVTTGSFSFDNNEATSAPSGTCELTLTAVTDNDDNVLGYTMYNSDHNYLYASKAGSGGLSWHETEDDYWHITNKFSSNLWSYSKDYSGNYAFLRTYSSSSTYTFRNYSSGGNTLNGATFYFVKKVSLSTTYYISTLSSIAVPSFDPESQNFSTASLTVTITANEGCAINYTIDGTDPETSATAITTDSNSATVTVTGTTTIKALAFDGNDFSAVVSQTYTRVYEVVLSSNGVDAAPIEVATGESTVLAAPSNVPFGYSFRGWTTTPATPGTLVSNTYTPSANVTLYAVFGKEIYGDFTKVTSEPSNWNGYYLIVFETRSVALDGSLVDMDVSKNTIDVSIDNSGNIATIATDDVTNASKFMFAPITDGYSIRSASGYYIGRTENKNGFNMNATTPYVNTLSYSSGPVITASAGPRLLCWSQGGVDPTWKISYYASNQNDIQLYKQEVIATEGNYIRVFQNETATAAIEIVGPSIIPSGSTLNMSTYALSNSDAANLIIEDGGQLVTSNAVAATVQKNIAAHGATAQDGGWNFIATPIVNGTTPSTTNGILSSTENDYDLFFYDEPTHYWRNYKYNDGNNTSYGFNLRNGQGYLYANAVTTTLSFTGTLRPSNAEYTVNSLSYTSGVGNLAGWNLVGNPFACNATVDRACYIIQDGVIVATNGTVAAPCSGVMVQATATEQTVTFTPTTNAAVFSTGHNQLNVTIANNMTARGESSMIDNAIVSFNENSQLEKFVFFEDNAKLYIPQGEKDYAIVSAEAQGEMPVCFKATKNGEYTITVSPEGVELNYLHLIDNMTGMDVDLLQTPSYTFEASTRDYESRFKLVFAGASTDSATDESFAYYDGSEWKVSNEGEATLQVVDVLGRIISTETINGNFNLNLNQKAGVYMLRLINGENVKVQKVVVR